MDVLWMLIIKRIKSYNTNNVIDMSLFSGCKSLKKLNLNNFNTNDVTDMIYMFSECSSLKELNLIILIM